MGGDREDDDVDFDALASCDEDTQRSLMRSWFLARYEDPQNALSYDSEDETGYAWPTAAGPYDAHVVLRERFGGVVPESLVLALADDLVAYGGGNWHRMADLDPDEDDPYWDPSAIEVDPDDALQRTLDDVRQLLEERPNPYVRRLALVGVVAALEVFLQDLFSRNVLDNEKLLRRYVEREPSFRNQKVALSSVFTRRERIRDEVRQHLAGLSWHRLDKVVAMYESTFKISVPKKPLDTIGPAVRKRHDILHRGGRTKAGVDVVVEEQTLTDLIGAVGGLGFNLSQPIDPTPSGF